MPAQYIKVAAPAGLMSVVDNLLLFRCVQVVRRLTAKTREIALRLAQGPQVCFRYMKENLNRAMAGDVDDCLDLEATHHVHSASTADHREAAQAFVEKRQPVFQGR